jgi:hypothetical protein
VVVTVVVPVAIRPAAIRAVAFESAVRSPAPVTAVVPAVAVAVEIVVATPTFPVRAPARVPELARAPVVRGKWRGLCLCVDCAPQADQGEPGGRCENRCG